MRSLCSVRGLGEGVFDDYAMPRCWFHYRHVYDLLGRTAVPVPFSAVPALPLSRMFGSDQVFICSDMNYKLFPAGVHAVSELGNWIETYGQYRDELTVLSGQPYLPSPSMSWFRGDRGCATGHPWLERRRLHRRDGSRDPVSRRPLRCLTWPTRSFRLHEVSTQFAFGTLAVLAVCLQQEFDLVVGQGFRSIGLRDVRERVGHGRLLSWWSSWICSSWVRALQSWAVWPWPGVQDAWRDSRARTSNGVSCRVVGMR
ncbi:hypothetical protein D6158_29880 [Nocardia seriolae]|nr:hypothetical protein C6575_35830 [Nocardia seriolae]RLP27399.1 hypothetical protein D6158_29880 [Nocardia seriolae]